MNGMSATQKEIEWQKYQMVKKNLRVAIKNYKQIRSNSYNTKITKSQSNDSKLYWSLLKGLSGLGRKHVKLPDCTPLGPPPATK